MKNLYVNNDNTKCLLIFNWILAEEKDTDTVLVLPNQIPRESENADWSYTLITDDGMSEWEHLMLAQFLDERDNATSETQRGS